jgi:hypothetical protein
MESTVTGKTFWLVVSATIVALAGFWYDSAHRKLLPEPPVILKEVQSLSQLVTVKYVMEKVVTHEVEKTFGKDKVLLVTHGVVKAGIDLGRMTRDDVRVSGKAISYHLPPALVTDAYLDEKQTFVYDRSTGLLIQPESNLESEARRLALVAIMTAAQAGGIHRDADERARELISKFSQLQGFEKVEFH